MNIEAIREWLNRQPFEPFVLRMSNGEVHEVRHPKNVALGRTRIAVSFPERDRFVHLSLIHVTGQDFRRLMADSLQRNISHHL